MQFVSPSSPLHFPAPGLLASGFLAAGAPTLLALFSSPRVGATSGPRIMNREPLWQLIVRLLPAKADDEWYTPAEIAPLCGIKTRSLTKHCRDLWPGSEGHYRLNRSQAERLVRRVCRVGRNLPAREAILQKLHKKRGDL